MAGSSGIICFKKRSATAWTLALQTFGKIGARYTQDLRHRLHREPSCGNKICRDIGFLTGLWKAPRRIWFSNVLRPRMCSSSRTRSSSFFTSALPITGSSESTAPPHLLAQEPAPTIRLEDMCGRLRARKKNLWRMASSLVRTCVAAAEHRPQPVWITRAQSTSGLRVDSTYRQSAFPSPAANSSAIRSSDHPR